MHPKIGVELCRVRRKCVARTDGLYLYLVNGTRYHRVGNGLRWWGKLGPRQLHAQQNSIKCGFVEMEKGLASQRHESESESLADQRQADAPPRPLLLCMYVPELDPSPLV